MKLNGCDLIPGFPSQPSPSDRGRACDSAPRPEQPGQGDRPSRNSPFDDVAGGAPGGELRSARSDVRDGEEKARVREDTGAAGPEPAEPSLTRPAVSALWPEALLQPLSETQGAAPAGLPSALPATPESGVLQGAAPAPAGTEAPQPHVPNGIPGPSLPAEGSASAAFADSKQTAPALTAEPIRTEPFGAATSRPADAAQAGFDDGAGSLPADFEPSDLPRDPGMSLEERGAGSREKPPEPAGPGTLPASARKDAQPVLEPPPADVRKIDAAAPEALMHQGAEKSSAADNPGRQAEPPLRTHFGSAAPPPEGKPADPAHPEFKGSFDASGKTAYLKIQDHGLGAMQWHLRMEGGRLAAEAIVQSARVQEVFQANQDVLQARLNELGVELEGFEVSVDQGSQGFFGRGLHKGTVPAVQGRGHDANPGTFIERVQANVTAQARGGVDLYA